jgi:hypothetical protein
MRKTAHDITVFLWNHKRAPGVLIQMAATLKDKLNCPAKTM